MVKRKLTPRAQKILKQQLKAFRKKFGREPGPGEPIFFDPEADTPTPLNEQRFRDGTIEAMKLAGVQPQIIYAFMKTGLLLREDLVPTYPPEAVAEWEAAIDEYFALEDAAAKRKK